MRCATCLILSLVLSGCSFGYYAQSIGGHRDLMSRRQPIEDYLENPDTTEELRQRLRYVQTARDFASEELLLPDNGSYRLYADLERPYAVWNVVAAPEFAMTPKTWCFIVVGCVAYRGYFDEKDAKAEGDKLLGEGHDVDVYGVTAYSTLGWFADPVLNTMLGYSDASLAGLIFHELAHEKLYVKDDSAFNEAFATFVEREGVHRWMLYREVEPAWDTWSLSQKREQQFVALVMGTRDELVELYAGGLEPESIRARKRGILADLKSRYRELRDRQWSGYEGYDNWFDRELNNAHLVSVGTYESGVPAFRRLYQAQKGDLEAFYAAAQAIADQPPAARQTWLDGR